MPRQNVELTKDRAERASTQIISYSPDHFDEKDIDDPSEIATSHGKSGVLWINVPSIEDHYLIQEIGKLFGIHRLALDDIISTGQRPKVDQYDDKLFVLLNESGSAPEYNRCQIAVFYGEGFVITFCEPQVKCLQPVIERIRNKLGSIRENGSDYLLYSIVDAVVDTYFPILENVGDELETLEDEIIYKPSRETIANVHEIKRELLTLRRHMWPMRELINALLRDEATKLSPEVVVHLRDTYDHAVQIIDFIETYRELGADLMDVYLSSISNRMNEVMKVLTIITTLFVPPTFIAGIYGMNFKYMPELNWKYGYQYALTLMLVVSLLLLVLLKKKGFLSALMPGQNVPERKK